MRSVQLLSNIGAAICQSLECANFKDWARAISNWLFCFSSARVPHASRFLQLMFLLAFESDSHSQIPCWSSACNHDRAANAQCYPQTPCRWSDCSDHGAVCTTLLPAVHADGKCAVRGRLSEEVSGLAFKLVCGVACDAAVLPALSNCGTSNCDQNPRALHLVVLN
jgi:hypothetical protein